MWDVCVPPTRPLSGRLGRPAGQGFRAPHGKLHVKFSLLTSHRLPAIFHLTQFPAGATSAPLASLQWRRLKILKLEVAGLKRGGGARFPSLLQSANFPIRPSPTQSITLSRHMFIWHWEFGINAVCFVYIACRWKISPILTGRAW